MDNALAVTGFYLTLIGFISGLFFTRLDGWYGSVREFEGGLRILTNIPGSRDQFEESRIKAEGLASSRPLGSFAAVGILMSALLLLSLLVPVDTNTLNPLIFLKAPLVVTVIAYWIGGFALLTKGKQFLDTSNISITESLKG